MPIGSMSLPIGVRYKEIHKLSNHASSRATTAEAANGELPVAATICQEAALQIQVQGWIEMQLRPAFPVTH